MLSSVAVRLWRSSSSELLSNEWREDEAAEKELCDMLVEEEYG